MSAPETLDADELARSNERLRAQQRAVSGVLRVVARSAGLQPVLDEVAEACRRLCAADDGALWLLEDGLLHSVAHHGEAEAAEYDRLHPHSLDRTMARLHGLRRDSRPEELLELLREYHTAIGELIPAYDGTLEHFAGDGLIVFFNDPVPVEDHELEAIRMALAVQERFDQLAGTWRKRGFDLGLGIGIAAGYATLGRIGFEGRYDYGALWPVTDLASRLSTHAEPGQILISQRVFAEVENVVDAKPVGEVELKGFGRPVAAYEIRGLR